MLLFLSLFLQKVYQRNHIQKKCIYECNSEVCCCCLKRLKTIKKRIYFSEEKEDYFDELKKILIEYYYGRNANLFVDTFVA